VKSILFLSGKGGTGKTSLAGAFAALMKDKILADCDVDAANLHLLLDPEIQQEGEFQGSKEAVKDDSKCIDCGECRRVCRFYAIDEDLNIDPFLCEGCGACVYVCPTDAIRLSPQVSGRWYTAKSRLGPLASAELYPGEDPGEAESTRPGGGRKSEPPVDRRVPWNRLSGDRLGERGERRRTRDRAQSFGATRP